MTNLLHEISCPHCDQPIGVAGHGPEIQCSACNGRFILRGHLCPQCHHYHQEEASICKQCGQALKRRCTQCKTQNWTGDEYCRQCGGQLDIFDVLTRHHTDSHRDFTARRQDEIQHIKSQEAAGSAARMARFVAQEQAHLALIQERREKDKRRENFLVIATILALGTCLATIILVFLIQSLFSTG